MIRLSGVSCGYEKGRKVLTDLDLVIGKGESVGLVGENGAGKSTLMKVLMGLLPYEGKAEAAGMEIKKENLSLIRKKLGLLLQNSDSQMFMPTVFADILFGPLNYGMGRDEAEKKADEVLESLGISGLKNRYNHRLSGGEKRMAAIAAVLVMEPETVLMDEPTAALDPKNRRIVMGTIRRLTNTKLIASHDLDMILDTCGRVILLSEGKIAADGPADRILTDQALLERHGLELPLRYQN